MLENLNTENVQNYLRNKLHMSDKVVGTFDVENEKHVDAYIKFHELFVQPDRLPAGYLQKFEEKLLGIGEYAQDGYSAENHADYLASALNFMSNEVVDSDFESKIKDGVLDSLEIPEDLDIEGVDEYLDSLENDELAFIELAKGIYDYKRQFYDKEQGEIERIGVYQDLKGNDIYELLWGDTGVFYRFFMSAGKDPSMGIMLMKRVGKLSDGQIMHGLEVARERLVDQIDLISSYEEFIAA